MKRLIAGSLALMMLFSNICYAASPALTKEETVYVNLNNDGTVGEMNIYSKVTTNGVEKIIDHTNYEKVTNLSNREEYTKEEDTIIWNVSGEDNFAYTGKVGEEYYTKLPWTFDITYKLNGVSVDASSLLGSKGLVEITLDIEANPNANEYYKNNYMLEVTGTFNMSDYLSLSSEDAMIINTGNEKTLLFVVLPGQSTTMHLAIGSENFKMNGITMAMVPLKGEILNQISDIAEEKKDVEDALDAMNLSADIILTSMGGMTSGISGISTGVAKIKEGTSELHSLDKLRDEDIANLKSLLGDMMPILEEVSGDIENLKGTYADVVEMSENLENDLQALSKSLKTLQKDLDKLEDVVEKLPKEVITIKDTISNLSKLMGNLSEMLTDGKGITSGVSVSKFQKALAETSEEIETVKAEAQMIMEDSEISDEIKEALTIILNSLEEVEQAIGKASKSINSFQNVVSTVSSDATSASKNLSSLKKNLNTLNDYIEKDDAKVLVDTVGDVNVLVKRADKTLDTILEYQEKFLAKSGDGDMAILHAQNIVDELESMNDTCVNMIGTLQSCLKVLSGNFYSGTRETTDSMIDVSNELKKLTSQSSTLKSSKDKIKTILDDKKDDIEAKTNIFKVDKDAKVVSFGAEENENVSEVEFLLKTPDIKKTKASTNVDLEKTVTENVTFWDRVIGIFKGIVDWIRGLFA